VARAARDPRRQAARLGLLVLASACAAAQDPPGGPPDFTPPVLEGVRPDSGAVLPDFDDPVVFAFNEVIAERQPAEMAKLFLVSPRPREVRVAWKRTRLEVKPAGGWRPDQIYRVTLLPGVADLRNNRLTGETEVVFSTGPAITDTRIDAYVIDWAAGRLAQRGLLEAWPLPITDDSIAYVAQPDSTGEVHLRQLPLGTYLVVGVVDENGNNRRDRREAFDSATVRLDSVATSAFWAFVHDTVGPPVREATQIDSVTVRVTFGQPLDPAMSAAGAVTVRQLPDSTPVAVAAIWTSSVYDSVSQAEAAARDSARQAAADSAAAADSTAPRDTAAVRDTAAPRPVERPVRDSLREPPARVARPIEAPRPGRAGQPAGPGQGAPERQLTAIDTARVNALLAERPGLSDRLVVRLAAPLVPGGRYLFEGTATNLSGATRTSLTLLAIPAAAAAESERCPATAGACRRCMRWSPRSGSAERATTSPRRCSPTPSVPSSARHGRGGATRPRTAGSPRSVGTSPSTSGRRCAASSTRRASCCTPTSAGRRCPSPPSSPCRMPRPTARSSTTWTRAAGAHGNGTRTGCSPS